MKFKQKIKVADDKLDDAFLQLDGVTRTEFIKGVMKEDGVTMEEAQQRIKDNPMYSMGLKWAIYRNRAKLDLRTPRKIHKQRFLESLTPEEREQYDQGPGSMSYWQMRRAEKAAEKDAAKEAERMKGNITVIDDRDGWIDEQLEAIDGRDAEGSAEGGRDA